MSHDGFFLIVPLIEEEEVEKEMKRRSIQGAKELDDEKWYDNSNRYIASMYKS
jgi:hypothetical protein